MPMNSSLVIIVKFLYSLKTWPQKLLVLFFIPVLFSASMFAFLTLKPSAYISSAKLELVSKNQLNEKISLSSQDEESIENQANLYEQLANQLQDERILYVLGCRLSAFDLRSQGNTPHFIKETGVNNKEILSHLQSKLEEVTLLTRDSIESMELDRLKLLSLQALGNDPSSLRTRIHLQWVPGTSAVLLKSYDPLKHRANFIVKTLCELAIDYQEEIGFQYTYPIIEAQKVLISNRRNSWEASKERIRVEQETINAGRGPSAIQEISRKILALKHSLVDIEARIISLRKQMRKKREEEKNTNNIIAVRYMPDDQENLILELSKNLNQLRIINAELKALQEKLQKYKELHLNNLHDQEKSNRKSLIKAQEYLQELLDQNAENLTEVRVLESAKTIPTSSNSLWVLTAFSFFAVLALWLILLLRIRYFR